MKHRFLFIVCLCLAQSALAQRTTQNLATLSGSVKDALTNEPLVGVTVSIQGMNGGVKTDSAGLYVFKNLKPAVYNLQFSLVGYQKKMQFDVQLSNAKPTVLDVFLEAQMTNLGEVSIRAPLFIKPVESPVSLRNIGVTEIKRNPGGNRDISKAIQSLPGVATQVSFRNDIVIRGGAPSENRFYIDGIEIPNINHFSTQGSSGGPVGLINVDFIRDVDFYSGAFPANRGNTLSSVFEFRQKDGRSDKLSSSLTVGSSDFATTLEGPIDAKTTFLASYRYSYLQGLFKLLGLPFLPAYQDYQFKIKHKINSKNELTFIGLGAIDRFKLNYDAEKTESNQYILDYIPVNEQNNYTFGITYRNYRAKGNSLWVISRNYFKNRALKYQDNDPAKTSTIDYLSSEAENKFRFENNTFIGGYKLNLGASAESSAYSTDTKQLFPLGAVQYQSSLSIIKYGLFAQLSKSFLNEKLNFSAGLRADANNFSANMNNLLKTLSPRVSVAYNFTEKLSMNANLGQYYQLPAYTLLGYRAQTGGALENTEAQYIRSKQAVLGFEYNTLSNTRFTVEGFYKYYDRYPMVRVFGRDIPLANLGADFGVVGNRELTGFTQGRSYGLELLAQKRLKEGFYGLASFTLFRSEFKDLSSQFIPSSWDTRYIVSVTAGKLFGRNWELGARFRMSGGGPFTPYDLATSSLKTNWDFYPRGVPSYNQLNSQRLNNFTQLDLRLDKKYTFKSFNLNLFLDIQNITNSVYQQQKQLVLDRSAGGAPQSDPTDATRYKMKFIEDPAGTILPTIGIIFDF